MQNRVLPSRRIECQQFESDDPVMIPFVNRDNVTGNVKLKVFRNDMDAPVSSSVKEWKNTGGNQVDVEGGEADMVLQGVECSQGGHVSPSRSCLPQVYLCVRQAEPVSIEQVSVDGSFRLVASFYQGMYVIDGGVQCLRQQLLSSRCISLANMPICDLHLQFKRRCSVTKLSN